MDTVYVVFGREGDFRWPISAHDTYDAAKRSMQAEGYENRTPDSTLEVLSVPFRRT